MKYHRSFPLAVLLLTALAVTSEVRADDDDWGWGHHHHHHHHHHHPHHHGWWGPRYVPVPAYYPPAPPVVYREIPRYRPYRSRMGETLPLVAGGVLGGVIANEIGYGNPAAVIGGSVLGSVLGHEIAH
ncbi:glycine zipper 2TM domain-containing protein [Candidatus Methylocalor cossyra]|uniref:Glycine zipper 2TM domain-containing protein n=1 Tax=Candidatus Methylocalor cossyra TaxID=3108543 RepID=A0ABM9NGG7_9GAMM